MCKPIINHKQQAHDNQNPDFISSANEGGGGADLFIFFLTDGFFSEVDEELLNNIAKKKNI